MKNSLTVLYLTSENTTTSIPLELATYMSKSDKIDLHIVTFYGAVPGEPLSFAKNVIDLDVPKSGISEAFKRVNKLMKEIKPDILHVHHNFSALVAILAAKYNKVKMVVKTEHNDHRFMKWHQKILNIPILSSADVVICNSVSTKNSFSALEKALAGKKAVPIYNGINVNKIIAFAGDDNRKAVRAKYGIASNERLFVCAARLIKQKNFDNLIKGFTAAAAENQNIKLLIAGAGNLHEELLALKNELDKFNNIQFLGIIPRDEVFKLINAADFFVMLSLWEGFCNAIVEAMVAKCPVISSDIVTLREVVGEEVGCFVQPKSIEDIKNAFLKYASLDEAAVKLLGEKSYKRAVELFSIERTATLYIDQYLKVQQS